MKTTIVPAAALAATLILGGCASTGAPVPVAEVPARQQELSTLNTLIAEAGLADTLKAAGPYTLFAPSDEAFKAVPAKTLAELKQNKALLQQVLRYHVVPGTLKSADLANGTLKTVEGGNVALSKTGGFVTVEEAVVVRADVPAANGVVHVIDRVLLPPKR